ncbi:MAG: IS481 family transposase [Burkholderiales bacterium]
MNVHKNARLTYHSRAHIVKRHEAGETPRSIASAVGVSPACVYKWLKRHKMEGAAGLHDRTSRPHRLRAHTPEGVQAQIEALRRERRPCWKIAAQTGVSPATAARICKRKGLARLAVLEPRPPVVRYEKETPGEMIHIDIKKLGRIDGIGHRITFDRKGQSHPRSRKEGGKGWEYLHLAVDDHSRLAYSEIFPDEKRKSCIRFLFNALRFFRRHGVKVYRVMTDNGTSLKSHRYGKALRMLGIKHKRTRPYTPKTNGKAERFVQTSLREWAYERPYHSSEDRRKSLLPFLHHYNYHRPHFGLKGKTPISRIPLNNLLRHDT